MNEQYFNTFEFKNAISILETNPYEAKIRFEEYLKKHPKDYMARVYYTFVLLKIKELDNIEEILNITEKDINEDPAYQNNSKNNITLKDHIIKSKLSLLSYQERYEELYHYYVKNLDRVNEMDENSVFFYCKKKLKKLDPNRRNENSYTFRQIVEYKESDFLEHEKNHLLDDKYCEELLKDSDN